MNEFIEIHLRPKGEAMIVSTAFIAGVWAMPNGGCQIIMNGLKNGSLRVDDSYEDLRKMLIGEGEV